MNRADLTKWLARIPKTTSRKSRRIFSGRDSEDMWNDINSAKTVTDLRHALHYVCCRLQELESKLAKESKESE